VGLAALWTVRQRHTFLAALEGLALGRQGTQQACNMACKLPDAVAFDAPQSRRDSAAMFKADLEAGGIVTLTRPGAIPTSIASGIHPGACRPSRSRARQPEATAWQALRATIRAWRFA
jgi:hypothetical protein